MHLQASFRAILEIAKFAVVFEFRKCMPRPTLRVVPSASPRHATWQAHQWQPLGGTERLFGPIIRRLCLRIIDLPGVPV